MSPRVRELDGVADQTRAEEMLQKHLGDRMQARMDALIDVLSFPGLIVEDAGRPVGLLTYRDDGSAVEIACICSEQSGSGRALIDALKARFPDKPLWLVTTNDNLRALRTYQRQGFALVELRRDAVMRARSLKPTIPMIGRTASRSATSW